MSIPKVIHYCWFGGNPLTPLAERCIASWKKYCPDYEIVCWDESNFDVTQNIYVKEAYENKKWAFVSDYARVFILYHYGGVYLDADAEVIKPIDSILINETAVTGYSNEFWIPAALIAAEKHNEWIGALLHYYDDKHFIQSDGSFDQTTNTIIITNISTRFFGFKPGDNYIKAGNVRLFPYVYFTPYKYNPILKNGTPKFKIDKHYTYVVHHFAGSWDDHQNWDLKKSLKAIARRVLPVEIYTKLQHIKYR